MSSSIISEVYCQNTLCQELLTEKSKQNTRTKDNYHFVYCARCVQFFDKKCFCDHCYQVYPDNNDHQDDTALDGRSWIMCSNSSRAQKPCTKWNHTECEEQRKEPADSDMRDACRKEGADLPYYCVSCRRLKNIKQKR